LLALAHPIALLVTSALAAYAARRELRVSFAASGALLSVAIAAAWLARQAQYDWPTASTVALLLLVCGLIAEVDRRHFLIPDVLVLAVAALAIGAPHFDPVTSIVGAATMGTLFYGVRAGFARTGMRDALGLGDVKLAAAMGLYLGPTSALFAVGVAAGVTAIWLAVRSWRVRTTVTALGAPFGVSLAAALFVAALHQALTQ
jgi:leader peptidase (prepilin peptidase)/N-methyltransferase